MEHSQVMKIYRTIYFNQNICMDMQDEKIEVEKGEWIQCHINADFSKKEYDRESIFLVRLILDNGADIEINSLSCNYMPLYMDENGNYVMPYENILESNEFQIMARINSSIKRRIDFRLKIFQITKAGQKSVEDITFSMWYIFHYVQAEACFKIENNMTENGNIQLYLRNLGNIKVKHVLMQMAKLDHYYVRGTFKIDDETLDMPDMIREIDMGELNELQNIKMSFETMNLTKELADNILSNIKLIYTYEKQGECIGNNFRVILCDRENSAKSCNDRVYHYNSLEQSTHEIVKISQKAECSGMDKDIIEVKIWIQNNKPYTINNLMLMYILHYRMILVPNSIRINGKSVKGNIKGLILPELGPRDQQGNRINIVFKIKIRKEFIENKPFCADCGARIRYTAKDGKKRLSHCSKIKLNWV